MDRTIVKDDDSVQPWILEMPFLLGLKEDVLKYLLIEESRFCDGVKMRASAPTSRLVRDHFLKLGFFLGFEHIGYHKYPTIRTNKNYTCAVTLDPAVSGVVLVEILRARCSNDVPSPR